MSRVSELQFHNHCIVKDCPNPTKGPFFYPIVKVWAKGHSKKRSKPLDIEVGMTFCKDHINYFQLSDLPTLPDLANGLCKSLKLAEPDLTTAEIEMRPLILG